MARIRTIKPEFFTSADITSLTPLARLFYVSLWCESDREGRLKWCPATLKIRYLPCDDCDISELSIELIEAGLIVLYEVDGKEYAEIPSFQHHQIINNRESDSIIPARVKDASARVKAEGRKEGKERKGTVVNDESFVLFWNAYPNKVAKPAALKAWQKVDAPLQTVLDSLARQSASDQWTKDNGKFIPHPATWLNQRRWEDGAADTAKPYINPLFAGAI